MRTIIAAIGIFLAAGCSAALGQQMPKAEAPRTITQILDRALTNVEEEFVPLADAMPEDKYGYAPTDGEFKGVRTFAEQVKHVAADNYQFGAAILQVKPPDTGGEAGPASVKTKAQIMQYLKDSFVYLHQAIKTINAANAAEPIKSPWGQSTITRLGIATLTVGHCYDHYGQMAVYLRHNGLVPPASKG